MTGYAGFVLVLILSFVSSSVGDLLFRTNVGNALNTPNKITFDNMGLTIKPGKSCAWTSADGPLLLPSPANQTITLNLTGDSCLINNTYGQEDSLDMNWDGSLPWFDSTTEKPGFFIKTQWPDTANLIFDPPITAFSAWFGTIGTFDAVPYDTEDNLIPGHIYILAIIRAFTTNNYKIAGGYSVTPIRRLAFQMYSGSFIDNIQYIGCPKGFFSPNCVDIDECYYYSPCGAAMCTNTYGSYTCTCKNGFEFQNDTRTCSDINECLTDPCQDVNSECVNTPGSYSCNCKDGYEYDNEALACVDVNECLSDVCGNHFVCTNTNGSYSCACDNGYVLKNETMTCTDIDECATLSLCSSFGNCTNTDGSYICTCDDGYELNNESITCQDIDECLIGACGDHATCTNTNGSYSCTCDHGYEFNSETITCNDINECTTLSPCSSFANCTNTDGSFTCLCGEGYTGDGRGQNGCTVVQPPVNSETPSSSIAPSPIQPPTSEHNAPVDAGRVPTSSIVSSASCLSFASVAILLPALIMT